VFKLAFSFITALFLASCSESGPPSTNTSSEDFSSLAEKQEFLETYVNFRRVYHALDFQIFYQNNSSGIIAGPSDWDIALAAQVPCDSINSWLEGFNKAQQKSDIVLNSSFDLEQLNEWYSKPYTVLGLNREYCIVYYHSKSAGL